jgi:hypothetical protein
MIDRDGKRRGYKALYALDQAIGAALSGPPRFDVVPYDTAKAAYEAHARDTNKPLSKAVTEGICEDAAVSGIVSIERLDLSDEWNFSTRTEEVTETQTVTRENGDEEEVEVTREVTIHEANLEITVDSNWKLYACDGEVIDTHGIKDARSWSAEGETRADARENVGTVKTLRATVLGTVGQTYRGRISPWDHTVVRRYFRGGSKQVRDGRKQAKSDDWDAAYALWKKGAKAGNPKAAAKAWHNLAVFHENKGNLKLALKYARRASKVLGRGWVDRYPAALEDRIADHERLGKQLGLEEEAD